uniref:Uncharacterized protein n=1 Tax=Leersia perrieri TaxID=77586 RepID=A0A0D9VWH7_9ORYZ
MSSASQPPQSPSSIGAWFCQISSGLRQSGRAEIDVAGKLKEVESSKLAGTVGKGTNARALTSSSCRGGAGATMPEATVCLLLDRFAPS